AETLVPGAGKSCTRITMSCTAMPAHRILRLRSLKADLALDPGAENVMRYGDRRRRGQAGRMRAGQEADRLVAGEPARVLELLAVHGDVVAQRLGMAADHQRHRKRPGLRGEVAHAAGDDAGLLERLAPHRILDRLTRLDEAGKARPHARHEPRRAPEQAAV